MKPRLINIKDKTILSKKRCCPPHYFPHKLPVGKQVTEEPCHYHNKKWRMYHHIPFCKFLNCPHYKFMMEKYKLKK